MAFFSHFKYKLIISTVIAVISSFYQLETEDELEIVSKVVLLSKSRHKAYEHLIDFEEYKNWFPNVISMEAIDAQKQMSIGKRFTMKSTYLFGVGESRAQLTVLNHQRPSLFEFLCDNFLMERNRVSLEYLDANKTRVTWTIHSRRRSLMFKESNAAIWCLFRPKNDQSTQIFIRCEEDCCDINATSKDKVCCSLDNDHPEFNPWYIAVAVIGAVFFLFLVSLIVTFICIRQSKKKLRRRYLAQAQQRRAESNVYVIPDNLEEVNQFASNNSNFYGQENLEQVEIPPPKYEDLPKVTYKFYIKQNEDENSRL